MDDFEILQRQIRASADADVADFIESLGKDDDTGIPPPPKIEISEVEATPTEFDLYPRGSQASEAEGEGPPAPVVIVCPSIDPVHYDISGMSVCTACFIPWSFPVGNSASYPSSEEHWLAMAWTAYKPTSGGNCVWINETNDGVGTLFNNSYGNTTCSGSGFLGGGTTNAYIGYFEGRWYVAAFDQLSTAAFTFYGSVESPGGALPVTINNELVCTDDFSTADPFYTWLKAYLDDYYGSTSRLMAVATGGTATLSAS